MSDSLSKEKPQIFLIIMLACVPICGLLTYMAVGAFQAFMITFIGLRLIAFAYIVQKDEKVRDKTELENEYFAILTAIPVVMIVFALWQGGIFSREDFVLNKNELSQVSGIVPEKYTHKGGYKVREQYYLTINGINLNCAENDKDYCKEIYQYAEKSATVYYQLNARNGNLVYEVVINDIKPFVLYDFDRQLYNFKKVRQQENIKTIAYFLIFFIMYFIFWLGSRNFADYLEVISDNEKIEYDKKYNKPEIKSPSIRDLGFLGSIMYVVGLFTIVLSLFVGVYTLFAKKLILLFIFVIIFVLSILMVNKAEKDAEKRHNKRFNIDSSN